jgi:short-subunit dehydrogenase
MPADRCARETIRAFADRQYLYLPGFTNRVSNFFVRFLPQRLLTSRVAAAYRSALETQLALGGEKAG